MTVEQEKVQGMLKEKLREKGWKVTRQRLSILQTLAEHKGQHLAAEDIFELMKDEYPEMGLATCLLYTSCSSSVNDSGCRYDPCYERRRYRRAGKSRRTSGKRRILCGSV